MQDIDFEELDRAVNSVSAPSAPKTEAASSDSVPVTVQSAPAPTPSTPAARRSSGRFMDVVHPSSDMRTSSVPERSTPRSEPESSPTPTTERSTDWPDPLDFHGFKDEPESTPEPVTPQEVPQDSLESPFLSDAKVEKRPLGGFSTETTVATPLETPNEPELLLEAPQEEELLTATTEESDKAEPISDAELPQEDEKPVIQPTPEPTPAPAEDMTSVPASITQQYKEQPSTTEQTSGPIFDTESYHQPLTHTPKKKSGALVVVWIAALILIGAGAGAAVYFFVLPML
ncbi:MAG: hypothetical protein WAV04_01670 [Candidatus Microsaccharimonas sp.]